jgi:hypothetical protein
MTSKSSTECVSWKSLPTSVHAKAPRRPDCGMVRRHLGISRQSYYQAGHRHQQLRTDGARSVALVVGYRAMHAASAHASCITWLGRRLNKWGLQWGATVYLAPFVTSGC